MMFKLIVQQRIWDRLPDLRLVVAYATDIDNAGQNERTSAMLIEAQDRLRATYNGADIGTLPQVASWRAIQPRKFTASHEALAKRVLAGKPMRKISPVVDAYMALCLDMFTEGVGAPIGAWCTDAAPVINLIETTGIEYFNELGSKDAVQVEPGEIAYADESGTNLITRHFVWRQSNLGAVSAVTQRVFFVSELIPPLAHEAAHVENRLKEMLYHGFGVGALTAILSAPQSTWEVS